MDFTANKRNDFTHKIADLRDQPNMQPAELKAYFDSSPEEVRQSHNALCDALTAATTQTSAAANLGFQRTAGVPADNVQAAVENVQKQVTDAVLGAIPSGSVDGDKLAQDVRDRFSAIESAAASEASARASADSAEATARANGDSNLQNQINTHTTQIAKKCEIYLTTYSGDGSTNHSKVINVGFRPKAVIVTGLAGFTVFSGMAVDIAAQNNGPIILKGNGFSVANSNYNGAMNQAGTTYFCLVFK